MNYSIIIEPHNGAYRALIPTLPNNLSAEGISRDDALRKARTAAETYLAGVEVVSVQATTKIISDQRPGSPQSVLQLAGKFNGDEAAHGISRLLYVPGLSDISGQTACERCYATSHRANP